MKTFGKFAAIFILITTFLCAGLYLVLNNLGLMLTEDHSGLECGWLPAGVEIKAGGRTESFRFKSPVSICCRAGKLEIKGAHNIVAFHTVPRLKLTWKRISAPVPKKP